MRVVRPPVWLTRTNGHEPDAARAVHIGLGLLLLAAAGLKLSGLNVSPFARYGWFPAPWLQMAAVQWEIVLGLWLLSGAYRAGAWLAAVGTFLTFAGVSGYLGATGQPSCGCLGRIDVSPWVMLGLDVVCVAALLVTPPAATQPGRVPRDVMRAAVAVLAVGLLVALLILGDSSKVVARMRGEAVVLPDGDADAGTAPRGELRVVTVAVENITAEPVRLIGGTVSCACAATADLPVTIPPHGRVEVRVGVRFTGEPGAFAHGYVWYTDSVSQPHVAGRIVGRVVPGIRPDQFSD